MSENDNTSRHTPDQRTPITKLKWFEPDTKPWWKDRWLVLLIAALIFLPLLGHFGAWDPWETHYGEVARNILERNDWISTWWGSHWKDASGASEGNYFFSKPILLMWMMALGMQIFGFTTWGLRIGVALVSILGIVVVYSMGASVYRRRTGFLMAAVVGTSPLWVMLSRQAQTDMPFVGLMIVGMCFFLMAMFGKDRNKPADLFSYVLSFGWSGILVIPQVILVLVGLSRWRGGPNPFMESFTSPPTKGITFGAVALGVGTVLLLVGLFKGRVEDERARKLRRWFSLGALGVVWAPLLVLLGIILVNGTSAGADFRGWFVWGPTQASIYATCFGLVVYLAFARPVVERRRVFLMAFYVFLALATMAKGLLGFMLPGAVLFFYILITREWRMLKRVDLHLGIPLFVAVGFPWYAAMLIRHTQGFWNRFFVHDHFKRLAGGVHHLDDGSFEYFIQWLGYGMFPWVAFIPAALGHFWSGKGLKMEDDRGRATLMLLLWTVLGFTLFTLASTKFHYYIFPVLPTMGMLIALALDDALDRELPHPWPLYFIGIGILGIVLWDLLKDPQLLKNMFTYKTDRKWEMAWNSGFRWTMFAVSVPAIAGTILLLVRNRLVRRASIAAIFVSATAFAYFCLDDYMPEISSTWSQKGIWDAYYSQCTRVPGPPGAQRFKRFCKQPVMAYKLNWRGETFYTQNEVIPIRDDDDWDYFVKQDSNETFYGIMEWGRYHGGFQRALPAKLKGKTCVVYNHNLKFVLMKVPCAKDDPDRVADHYVRVP